ncbi:MAG: glutathione S-transferase [Robiginitomaculum sp.]|nr:MAG: glutathione S-transferase [Robiginitomaculum sp.]
MIEFFKFPSAFGMHEASPFVLKLETYLRLAGLEYKTTETSDPRPAPKEKLPYIIDDGETIADSSICISYLKEKYGDTLGENLTNEQHAIGHAVKTMLEERTYWVVVYTRWMMPENQKLVLETWFGMIPKLIRGFITGKIVKDMRKGMYAHGIGRHSHEEIFAFGVQDVKAFEDVLGDKPYLLGKTPSEYDACGYGFLASIMAKPFPTPLSAYVGNSKTLMAYIDRVEMKAFG